MRGLSIGLLHFLVLNAMSGVIVAGIDAGKVYNTWPLMNNTLAPVKEFFTRNPYWTNFFENRALV
jgi:cytochrome c oxidase assembly protein subunit 15